MTFYSPRFWQITAVFIALFSAGSICAQPPLDPPVKPTVSGKFIGNGKNAAIQYVLVEEHEAFSGKEAITLIFTEKDPSKAKRPSWDAMFGKLGSALVLNVHHDGGLFGCQVSHSAHAKQGFTSLGSLKMEDFEFKGGNVSGHVSTGKEVDTFGEKWEVDLKFTAPLPEKLRNVPAAKPTPAAKETAEKESSEEDEEEEPKAKSGALISARKLPLPADATNVEYKTTVKHILFTSPRSVEAVAKEFSANLKKEGWKDAAGSLISKQNAILRKEQGDATLTIMVQPAGAGSSVKVFTEGLDWE